MDSSNQQYMSHGSTKHDGQDSWYGHGNYGYSWGWGGLIVIIIIIIICIFVWWAWSSNRSTNSGGRQSDTGFRSSFSGGQEVPPTQSTGSGNGNYILTGTSPNYSLMYDVNVSGLSSQIQPSHFHLGKTGTNGPVIKTMDMSSSTGAGSYNFRGVWRYNDTEPLTPERVQQLLAGELYVNIHTTGYPDGELRGQVLRN